MRKLPQGSMHCPTCQEVIKTGFPHMDHHMRMTGCGGNLGVYGKATVDSPENPKAPVLGIRGKKSKPAIEENTLGNPQDRKQNPAGLNPGPCIIDIT